MKRNDISTGELLGAMIDGKCGDWNNLDFKMYLEENGLNNRESLRLLLEEIDNKIKEFHDSFFVSEYDKYQHGVGKYPKEVTREFEDYLDNLYHEEVGWEQVGKKRYTLDSLYQLMNEQNLFFNEAHEIAVNNAYNEKNCKLLRRFYEEYVLRNVQEFRRYIKGLLDDREVIPVKDRGMQGEPEEKTRLTNRQMALICFYQNIKIGNSLKGDDILKKFGSKNTSGKKLYDMYQKIENDTDRLGAGEKKSNSNKIKDFKKVIEYFESQGKVPENLSVDYKQLKENIEKS